VDPSIVDDRAFRSPVTSEEALMGSYVGIDLHRRRSVIVVMNEEGEVRSTTRIDNDPVALAAAVAAAGPDPEVVVEATWGWYWAAEVIAEAGGRMHLAHPLGIKGFENRRVKNDVVDATLLADLLRMGRLPEAWIAPAPVRELRELVRYRRKLSRLRAGLKAQVHQTLGKEGVLPPVGLWGPGGARFLNSVELGDVYLNRVESLRDLLALYNREIIQLDGQIHRRLKGHPGYGVIQQIGGVGPVLAAVFVAEIGDVTRFADAGRLCSWAGLTPRHRESDAKVRRGGITKQGPTLVRWAAAEAVSSNHTQGRLQAVKRRVGDRRGRNIGRTAAARQLLTLVYYGLRDGEIRCLAPTQPA
jgi:transposase